VIILLSGLIVASVFVVLWPGRTVEEPADIGLTIPPTPTAKPTYTVPSRVEQTPDPGVPGDPVNLSIPAIGVNAPIVEFTVADAMTGTDPFGNSCYQDGTITCINPPRMDLVYQQIGGQDGVLYGDDPGMTSQGMVYLFGHAGARSGAAVFDNLAQLQPGDTAEVTTTNGILTYVVAEVLNIPKEEYATTDKVLNQVPGRLLLVSCDQNGPAYASGYAYNNVIAILDVESARVAE
jgi:hypothetical protein